MEMLNAKNRSSEFQEGLSHIGNVENRPRSVGASSDSRSEYGTYQVSIGGENSERTDITLSGERTDDAITGKLVRQLVNETEKQLAYHEQQSEILRERLEELKQISNTNVKVNQVE